MAAGALRSILLGVGLGLGAAVPLGPVNVEIARRSLRFGMPAGTMLGLGACTVDVIYAVLTAVGARDVSKSPYVFYPISVAGIAFLLWIAFLSMRGAWRARNSGGRDLGAGSDQLVPARWRTAYATGLLMTFLNPMTLAFWFVAVPGTIGRITGDPRRDLPFICLGVFLATLSWVAAFSSLMGFLGRYRKGWWVAAADATGGAILLTFALAATVRLLRPLI